MTVEKVTSGTDVKIKTLIFDVGNVLLHRAQQHSLGDWEKLLKAPHAELERLIYGGEMGIKAVCGEISDDELWDWVARRFSLTPQQQKEMHLSFLSSYAPRPGLVRFIRELRGSYQLAIISNASTALRFALENIYRIADAFDLIVCSAEEKLVKPNQEIYRRTLSRLGAAADSTLLIDDRPDNIASAIALGMKGLLVQKELDIPVELRKLGIVPRPS